MISEEQRLKRKQYLCSSDVAPILGCSPWRDQYDVFLEKTYDTAPVKETAAMRLGNKMEPYLIEVAAEVYGLQLVTESSRLEFISGIHMSHPDAITEDGRIGVEAKFSMSFLSRRTWNAEQQEGIPEHVWCQAQHQMYCCGTELTYVPVMITTIDPPVGVFEIPVDHDAMTDMITVLDVWWQKYVVAKLEPCRVPCPSEETVKRIIREPKTAIDLACLSWVERWIKLRGKANRYKNVADKMRTRLETLPKNVEGGNLPDGRQLTYYSQRGADTIDRAKLQEKLGKKYKQFVEESTHRVLRIKK